MKSSKETEAVFTIIGILAIGPIVMIANALSIFLLWGWFAVPLLGLNAVSLVGAFGVSLLASALVGDISKKAEDEGFGKLIAKVIMRPISFVTLGWIAHFFI